MMNFFRKTPSGPSAKLADGSNGFGFDLWRRLGQTPGNLVISPTSLTTALAMTWSGARGETATQMGKTLHLDGAAGELTATLGELIHSLQSPDRPVVLRIANQLFAERAYEFVPDFAETIRAAFGAPVERLDFIGAAEAGRVHINDWVETRTGSRIKDLIPPGWIDPLTRLVLVNAIYFLGDWAEAFEHRATHPAPFHLTASRRTDVETMNRSGTFRIARRDGLTAVEIPYKRGEMSMLLLVPDEVEGLAAVEKALDSNGLGKLVRGLGEKRVRLSLPRFELNPATPLALASDLAALGMPLAFDPERADFTAMANPPDASQRLYLSQVFHKGFVRVDEKGTEAAAATAAIMQVRSSPAKPPRQIEINADRPFLFLIRENASGLVLFLGRVSDPSRT